MKSKTIEQIHSHASVRNYKPDPVQRQLVETIVAAGQRSSTSSNLQVYSVVAVTDADRRDRLAELCGNQGSISQAPVFLAWCADFGRLERAGQRRGYQVEADHVEAFLVAAVDTALAMQNAALAAESLGLGICYIGGIRNRPAEVIELLDMPHLVFPISGMTVGWPAFEHKARPRLPLRAVLHWEQYNSSGEEEELSEYDRP
jgi:FMN reductase (NADPH)